MKRVLVGVPVLICVQLLAATRPALCDTGIVTYSSGIAAPRLPLQPIPSGSPGHAYIGAVKECLQYRDATLLESQVESPEADEDILAENQVNGDSASTSTEARLREMPGALEHAESFAIWVQELKEHDTDLLGRLTQKVRVVCPDLETKI
jgi:hypothetical protein